MRIVFLMLLSCTILLAGAQEEVPELITDRPDQTESSAVIPLKYLQIETGFVLENDKTSFFNQKSVAYNTTLLRYGLFANFELRLGLEYLGEIIEPNNSGAKHKSSGIGPVYTGFKVEIAEENGIKPEMAFLGGLIFPFTANKDFKPENTAADIRFAFSHTLSKTFSLGYNLGAEWDGNSAVPGYFYSLALGVGITEKLGMYVEGFGIVPEEGVAEHHCDAGLTSLVFPNFQLDVSSGIGLNKYASDNFISFGITYRIPK